MSKPRFTSYRSPAGGPRQGSPDDHHSHPHNCCSSVTSSSLPPLSNAQLKFNMLQCGSQFGGNMPPLPHGLPIDNQLQNQWASQSGLHPPGNYSGLPNNFSPQRNGLIPPQLPPLQHSNQMRMKFPEAFGRLVGILACPDSDLSA